MLTATSALQNPESESKQAFKENIDSSVFSFDLLK